MVSPFVRRSAIAIVAWLPFFAIWTLTAVSFSAQIPLLSVLISSMVAIGSAGVLGLAVWFACQRWPWPSGFSWRFYATQIVLAACYGAAWSAAVLGLELLRGAPGAAALATWPVLVRQTVLGMWFYAVIAGMFHAVQTRDRLQDNEIRASRAEALVADARLEALRARLNPHFLFNALHTLSALIKFRPAVAEGAVERLGDMLRYTLKEDRRGLVEFSEELNFTRQYLAFEQLRYEERLRVHVEVAPGAHDFDLPPFAIQTLAENAVHHAIAVRPEGGSIWLTCTCQDGGLHVSVRDDGPGATAAAKGESHRFGLRSVRERLIAAFGPAAELRTAQRDDGFEARFIVPAPGRDSGGGNGRADA